MSGICQEDLERAIVRLREAGLITSQTCAQWAQMLAAGSVDFVRARGIDLSLSKVYEV